MKVYTSVVLLLLGSVFAIAAAGPISKASIKDMISDVLSQEVQYNAGMQMSNSPWPLYVWAGQDHEQEGTASSATDA